MITNNRLPWLDLAKAVMLVAVILEHTEAGFLSEWTDNFMLSVFWLGAGYVGRPDFSIARKAKSLLLPYLVMNILCLLFQWLFTHSGFDWLQIEGVLYARFKMFPGPLSDANPRLYTDYNSVLWFLPSMFVSFLVYKYLAQMRGVWKNVAAISACVVATWLAGFLPVLLPWSLDTAPAFGAVIYMGRLLRLSGWMEKYPVRLFIAGGVCYCAFNWLTGITNISIGEFGRSEFLWFSAAVTGSTSFIALCSLAGTSLISRAGGWLNKGALFIFGMQLVFHRIAQAFYAPLHIDHWQFRILIVLIFVFAGGKLLARLYSLAVPSQRPRPNPL